MDTDIPSWIERLRSGDFLALARAVTTVENRSPGCTSLLKSLFPYTGHARIIGLTGAPGAGKSTLVDQLARYYRKRQKTLGIVAVDPTSPFSGGAILGDRIRMQDHFADPGIYMRSMATRGSLGGLAATTADVATVLDAAGRDLVLIETVGVGQDEVDVVRVADITIVILVPGMGDDVQSIKAGIMEIADIFVINKSDYDGAERVEQEIRALQSLAPRGDGWTPPVVKTIASQGKGIEELTAAIGAFEFYLKTDNRLLERSTQNWQARLITMLRDALLTKAEQKMTGSDLARYAAELSERRRDPYTLIEELIGEATDCSAPKQLMPTIDHIGIAVNSIAAAKELYEKLGLRFSSEEIVEAEQVRLVMAQVGESRMEILEPLPDRSPITKFLAKRGEGLHHVCLRVPDLESVADRLKSAGIRLVSNEIKIGAGGHRYIFVHPASANGVLLELVEGF